MQTNLDEYEQKETEAWERDDYKEALIYSILCTEESLKTARTGHEKPHNS